MKTQTLVIDNFKGSMTQYLEGDINSGLAYAINQFGNDPFTKPGNLTWCSESTQIDPSGSVISDLIMAGKERVEGGVLYVYVVGHTGRVYKIQVNDPVTYNPDYDHPVLLTTITSGSPTFTRGGYLDFYGATEKIYIGHDKGVTTINFDGTGESVIAGTWTQTVPRPLRQFLGNLYVGNGSNIAEINSTGTVTTSTKLSPGFPTNSQVRDLDVTTDGNYLQAVVSELALADITSGAQDTSVTANSRSYIFKWNGTDVGYTAFDTFPSFSLTANQMFQNYQYTFGYDQFGSAMYAPVEKTLSLQETYAPHPNAIASTSNLLMWASPLHFDGILEADFFYYGSLDFEIGPGYWDLFGQYATAPETDIACLPFMMSVSNFGIGSSSNGYTDSVFGTNKIYFSTLETSAAPTTAYRFYKWTPPSFVGAPAVTPFVGAWYQTQNQLFSKKVRPTQVRVYGEPWIAGNSFSVDLNGSSGTPIPGASKTFTAGSNLTIGEDFAWYTPQCAPTYALGLQIINQGSTNHTIAKVEIDVTDAGQ